jgi:hypothetical protein
MDRFQTDFPFQFSSMPGSFKLLFLGPGQYFKEEINSSLNSAKEMKNSYRSIFKSKVSKFNNDKNSTNRSANPKIHTRIKSQKEARVTNKKLTVIKQNLPQTSNFCHKFARTKVNYIFNS